MAHYVVINKHTHPEADTRKAFIESMTVEVINPLIALKVGRSDRRCICTYIIVGNTGKDTQTDTRGFEGSDQCTHRLRRERLPQAAESVLEKGSRSRGEKIC